MRKFFFIGILLFLNGVLHAQNNTSTEELEKETSTEELKNEFLEKKEEYKHTSTKGYTDLERNQLNEIEGSIEAYDVNSFEYNLVHYMNGNYDVSRADFLFKAYSLRPDDAQVQKEMFGYYLLTGDKTNQIKFAKIIEPLYSSVEYKYFEHLLEDKEKVAILVSGQDDSYPMYVLQLLKNKGEKALVINLDFMQSEKYRTTICEALEIENMEFIGNENKFLTNMVYNKAYPAFISTTVHQNYCAHLADQLYLSGLYYSVNGSEQMENLKAFWLSFQERGLEKIKFNSSSEKLLYRNYIPPLLTLYKLKKLEGNTDKVLRQVILVMANNLGIKENVETILSGYDAE